MNNKYSDYELYQILDESGYKPTEKNLSILKEGLETGKYEIIDEGFHPIAAIKTHKSYKDDIKNAKRDVKSAVQLRKADEHTLKSLPKDKRPGSLEDDDLKRETETEIRLKGKLGQLKATRKADVLNTLKNGPRDEK